MTRVNREEDKPDAIYEINSSKFTTVVHHGGSFYRTLELIYTANDNDVLEMVSKLPRNHYVHVYLEEVLTACSDANVEPDCNVEVSDVGSFEPEINVEVSDVAGSFEPNFNVEDNNVVASFEPDFNVEDNDVVASFKPDCNVESSKQDTIADSTTEAEYIAASEAAKEAVWIKNFITELGVIPSIADVVDLYCDNNGAIAQAKEPRSHQRSKHILRRFHLIWESIDRGDVEICKVHTDDNIADPLTKPLAQQKHDRHTESLDIRYVSDWS
ncbi:hypothetical protein GQ457_01G012970 [Hibiscus cannabinus]